MKISWAGLIIMAVLCIAMDVYICRRLKRNGYRWAMWFNVALALLAAALVIAIGVLPMSSAAMSNGTFVTCQYMLYGARGPFPVSGLIGNLCRCE